MLMLLPHKEHTLLFLCVPVSTPTAGPARFVHPGPRRYLLMHRPWCHKFCLWPPPMGFPPACFVEYLPFSKINHCYPAHFCWWLEKHHQRDILQIHRLTIFTEIPDVFQIYIGYPRHCGRLAASLGATWYLLLSCRNYLYNDPFFFKWRSRHFFGPRRF